MNPPVIAKSDARVQLSWNTLAKSLGVVLLVGVFSLYFSLLPFWLVLILIIPVSLTDIWSSIFITSDFLQKGQQKLLFSDLQDVRRFLWWYILIDRFDDSLWIIPSLLSVESRTLLESRLGIQGVQGEKDVSNP